MIPLLLIVKPLVLHQSETRWTISWSALANVVDRLVIEPSPSSTPRVYGSMGQRASGFLLVIVKFIGSVSGISGQLGR